MKKLGILMAVFGLFALAGVASASTADQLQPAQTITYNEELVVNATARFDSAYIGSTEAGVGGVTFFNGTMINNSVDEDGESTVPLTLGDDVRIDGQIYRTEVGGDNPIKLADSIRPQTTATYDLGEEDYQFNSAYFAGDVTADTLTLTGALTGTTATLSGDLTAQGDINQDLADHGAIKAMAFVPGDCTTNGITRQWTYDDSVITCVGSGGSTTLTFGFDINDRYWNITPALSVGDDAVAEITSMFVTDNDAQITVVSLTSAGAPAEGGYMITVY